MIEVRFFDFDFNRMGEFPHFLSLNFEKNFCGYGTAEIHFSITQHEVLEILEKNSYLIFAAGEDTAVVTGWKIGDDIAVFGRTPEWLLTKRGVAAFSYDNESAEAIAANVLNSVAGDFAEVAEFEDLGEKISYSTDEVRVLHDVITQILGQYGLGFALEPDFVNKKFVFRILRGCESTVLLSEANRTAYDTVFMTDILDLASGSGWYKCRFIDMGGWNAAKNSPTLSNGNANNYPKFYKITDAHSSRFNLNCVEGEYLYCDNAEGIWKTDEERPGEIWGYVDNPDVAGAKKWDVVLNGTKTVAEAMTEISGKTQKESSELETRNVEYGVDYDLGDIVRVQVEFGQFKRTFKKRITSVNIYYDADKSGVKPVFGNVED
ncbi:MAG: hypothetical protein IJN96_02960 [Clostridia bacterium]|nr:hypothetical protein [Clostridia bacterium]